MDESKSFDERRKSAKRRIFQREKDIFVCSLTPLDAKDSRWERQIAYMASLDKYSELKKTRELPLFCRVLENIQNVSRDNLMGDTKSDPVYNFLLNVKQRIYPIAGSQYHRSPEFREGDLGSQDYGVYLENKERFLDSLIDSFESRGREGNSSGDWSPAAKVNTEGRYNYLAGLASLEGKARNRAIREFVRSFPGYAWDNFYWPNERIEVSMQKSVPVSVVSIS